jgi:hypothetical protein
MFLSFAGVLYIFLVYLRPPLSFYLEVAVLVAVSMVAMRLISHVLNAIKDRRTPPTNT